MPTGDGQTLTAGPTGVYVGDGGAQDKMAGGSGNDKLEGTALQNIYYGGAGNDTFIVDARYLDPARASNTALTAADISYNGAVTIVTDFGGAGGWFASSNDFLAFTGFGAGSTITEIAGTASSTSTSSAPNAVLHYYDLYNASTGKHYLVHVNSVNGASLANGDFAFY